MMFEGSDGHKLYLYPCEVCFAAVILNHDADYEEHMNWHEQTRTK